MRIYVLQTRWLGGDDWANDVFLGKTEEEAKAAALDAYNALIADDPDGQTAWVSFAELLADSEFYAEGYYDELS